MNIDYDSKQVAKLINIFNNLGARRKIRTLLSALDIMQGYNGQSISLCVAKATYLELNNKELKHIVEIVK